jgi:hypothetical protein
MQDLGQHIIDFRVASESECCPIMEIASNTGWEVSLIGVVVR